MITFLVNVRRLPLVYTNIFKIKINKKYLMNIIIIILISIYYAICDNINYLIKS